MVKLAELKDMVGNVIDENTEQAEVDFHKYFGKKVQLAAGIVVEMKVGGEVRTKDGKKIGKIVKMHDGMVTLDNDKEYDEKMLHHDPKVGDYHYPMDDKDKKDDK